MQPDEKNTTKRQPAHYLKNVTDSALHIGNMRDVATSKERLHTLFFSYVTHIFDDGIQEDEHSDICALYLEFRALLESVENYQDQLQKR